MLVSTPEKIREGIERLEPQQRTQIIMLSDSINKLYEKTPPEFHDEIDRVRENIGGILSNKGMMSYDEFSDLCRTIKETTT